MNGFGLSAEEADALRATVREVLRHHEEARPTWAAAWDALASDVGITAIAVPRVHGGHGFGRAEVAIVHEEMGRALFAGPYFATVSLFASLALATGDNQACAEWLPAVAQGSLTGTVAAYEHIDGWLPIEPSCEARLSGGGWTLHGKKDHVINADQVDLLLVLATAPEGLTVFAVESGASGVRVEPRAVMDESRDQATVYFEGAAARQVGELGAGGRAFEVMLVEAAVALAAEQVGAMEHVLEFTIKHVLAREQFGAAIGSFQAVKHLCADMLLDVESARAVLGAAVSARGDEATTAAHAAKSFCCEAAWRVTSTALQLHGGIGFTWEHQIQRYLKRAKSTELLFGTPAEHRRALLDQLNV